MRMAVAVNAWKPDAIQCARWRCREHGPFDRARSVGTLFGALIRGERDRNAVLHQRGRLFALGRCNEVERAHLIVFSPTDPGRKFILPSLLLNLRHTLMLGRSPLSCRREGIRVYTAT